MRSDFLVDRLLSAVAPFVPRGSGTHVESTSIPRMRVWSSTQKTSPTPAVFQPMFYAVLRGTKALEIGGRRFDLNPGGCASSSFGLPYIGQITNATQAAPYVAISLDLNVTLLTNVMLDMPKIAVQAACSVAGGRLEGAIADSFVRLVELLAVPDDRAMLGRPYEVELYYRLLQSPMRDTLRQLGERDGRLRQIKIAADWLCSNPEKPVVIAQLADLVGMSRTSFHRHFKAATGYSPLTFQRHMRLLEARRLLGAGGISVSRVAYAVGYASPSQFSREYKSLFGAPPATDLVRRENPVV